MRDRIDRSSKWLIENHGDSVLRLAGLTGVRTCRSLQSDLVHPRQLPDGLLEVEFEGSTEPELFLIEVATYPERRLSEQILRDTMLVALQRRSVPNVLSMVLRPKGRVRATGRHQFDSSRGWTRLNIVWRVVELWKLSADELLACGEPGVVPWIPLTDVGDRPERIFKACRERLSASADDDKRANLLAVTQVLAGLRFDDPRLLSLFGGERAMMESPVLLRFLAKGRHRDVLQVLSARFGDVPADLADALREIIDERKLDRLVGRAATCSDLTEFRDALAPMRRPVAGRANPTTARRKTAKTN